MLGTYTVHSSVSASLLSDPTPSLARNEVEGSPSPDCPNTLMLNEDTSERGVLVVAVATDKEGTWHITLTLAPSGTLAICLHTFGNVARWG